MAMAVSSRAMGELSRPRGRGFPVTDRRIAFAPSSSHAHGYGGGRRGDDGPRPL